MSVPIVSLVSIRVGEEGLGIQDSLVIYQLVPFVLGLCVQLIGFWFAYDVMSFGDLNLSGFQQGFLDFVLDILTHDVVVELGLALAVETEPSHLTLHVSLISGIPIILGMKMMESVS